MEIKESDVVLLDSLLQRIVDQGSVNSLYLIIGNIIEFKSIKHADQKKEAQSMFEYAIPYITNYCGKINENGGFGDRYNLVSDHRTINFSMNGGFSALYKNQEEKSVKDKEKESLLIRISKLQEDDLLHKKKIRSQNTIIRIWQIASAIFAIISGLSIFLKY